MVGEKPHSCELCGKPFRVRSDMKRHLKTHGRKKPTPNKSNTQAASSYATGDSDLVITKIEESEISGGISENSNDERKDDAENSASSLQFDNDPLDTSRTL